MNKTDFEALFTLLVDADVEFVVIGGIAAIVHGSAALTYDLDICYRRSHENIKRLCEAMQALHPTLRGAPPGIPFRFDVATVQAGLNFTLETDLGAVDLLGEVQPFGFYEQVVAQAEAIEILGFSIYVLTLRALIESKRAAARHKDLNALPELEALLELQRTESN